MSAFLTSCDACGFECDSCYVDGAWQFLCPLCESIERFSLEAKIADNTTSTRTVSAGDFIGEKMAALEAFESTMARMRLLLASIERNTVNVNASLAR